jgi:microcystin-dependent protein
MPLESASFINGLDPANPAAGDTLGQADDHIRLIKNTVKATFPNITGAVTLTQADLNGLLARLTQLEAGNYIGKVSWNAGPTLPPRHLLANGQAVSRTTYAALFAAIGVAHGAGNGTTTFNVPDVRGTILAGLDNMGGTDAGRMNILGAVATTLGGRGGSQNLAQHNHALTDPGHGHTGTATSAGAHTHPLTDPGHAHGPPTNGFSHPFAGIGYGTAAGGGLQLWYSFDNVAAATTGISVQSAGDHTHPLTVNGSVTGITVNNAGTGTSGNIPPVLFGNYVIFAGA